MALSKWKYQLSLEFPNLLSLNAYEIWAAIGKTVAGKGLPRREMTASWPDWLRRTTLRSRLQLQATGWDVEGDWSGGI